MKRGQVLGLVGNSGNSTEPHLHFHVGDTSSPLGTQGLPYAFAEFEVEGRIGSLQADKIPWTPLAAPERRTKEVPMENVIVRFPGT